MATVAIMWNKQFLLEKWHLKTCWMQGCHKLSFVKKKKKQEQNHKTTVSTKHNEVKCSKTRPACTWLICLDNIVITVTIY